MSPIARRIHPAGSWFEDVQSGSSPNTGTALRSRGQGAHPTLLEAGSNEADFSQFQARNRLLLLLNLIDLKRGIQITVIAMGVKVAGMRRLMFLTCSLV